MLSTSWALEEKADKLLHLTEHTQFEPSLVESPEPDAAGNARQDMLTAQGASEQIRDTHA